MIFQMNVLGKRVSLSRSVATVLGLRACSADRVMKSLTGF